MKFKIPDDAQEEVVKRFCSFCCSSQDNVDYIVASPVGAICNDCVDICADLIRERRDTLADIIKNGT